MAWFNELISGSSVASSILKIVIVAAVGVAFGKIKVKGLSLGVTGALFMGILFAHFGMVANPDAIALFKEFGLILFVYALGMQVGPGFFSTFKKGGVRLNLFAFVIVLLGCVVTYGLHLYTKVPIAVMVGIMSGAVTNTPGLGAAQQANLQITGIDNPDIAAGYAVAYPLAVVGTIFVMLFFNRIFAINSAEEERRAMESDEEGEKKSTRFLSIKVTNKALDGLTVTEIKGLVQRDFVISRIRKEGRAVEVVNGSTRLNVGDAIYAVTSEDHVRALVAFIGEEVQVDWDGSSGDILARDIVITRPEVNGKSLFQMHLRDYGINITRIKRMGLDFVASPNFLLQMGDRVVVVGSQRSIDLAAEKLGNSKKKLNAPNLFQIFMGIAVGIVLGSLPIFFPGISQPVKLGLAGGPLVVAILVSRFGLNLNLITYTTESANLMLRDVGIVLFLASIGLSVGGNFAQVILDGGYKWIAYGILITVLPILLVGFIARRFYGMNYFTLCGLIAGAMTDAPALAIVNEMSSNDIHSMSYAAVYPMTMFLRVVAAQLMVVMLS